MQNGILKFRMRDNMCADSLFESVQYSKNWIPNSAKKDIFFRIIKGLKKDIDGWESDVLAGRYDKKNRAMKGLEGKGSKIIKLTVPGAWKLAVNPTKK